MGVIGGKVATRSAVGCVLGADVAAGLEGHVPRDTCHASSHGQLTWNQQSQLLVSGAIWGLEERE